MLDTPLPSFTLLLLLLSLTLAYSFSSSPRPAEMAKEEGGGRREGGRVEVVKVRR